jgi:hypothetical protein
MSEIERGWFGGACCFKCAYNLVTGSKAGYILHRKANGAVDDPLLDTATGSLCLHNPDAKGKGLGYACKVCDLFELDTARYHDVRIQRYEWENMVKLASENKGQMILENWS